ncbi:MAG: hypothetical protein R6X13_12185, partial [bacterium]
MLTSMMAIILVVAGAAGGVAVQPVVVAEDGNGKVTLRYDLVPPAAHPQGQSTVAGSFDDWWQQVSVNSETGVIDISGTNPNGNGWIRHNGQCGVGRLSWNGNQYAWRIPNNTSSVEYIDIDLTGYGSGGSVEVWAAVCARGGNAGPQIFINGSGSGFSNVGTTWELRSITRAGDRLQWNSANNSARVQRTSSSTDTLGVGFIRVYIYGAVPIPPAPGPFNLSLPANGATNQPTSGNLTWQASSNATSYDVYFGTSNPPPLLRNTTSTSTPYSGTNSRTYYWYVVAKNSGGIRHTAQIRPFDEFSRQRLLPRRMNGQGPAVATGDVNAD